MQDDAVELVGAQRGQHRAAVAQATDHEDPLAGRVEVVEEHLGAPVAAVRVVGAIEDDERLVADDLEAAGHAHAGERLRDEVARQRRRRTPRPR